MIYLIPYLAKCQHINICMKYILPLIMLFSLAACDPASDLSLSSNRLPKVEQTLAHKAYYWYGLSEEKDRQVLKDITGVDPVITEWCAAFVNMVLLENGLPTSADNSPYPLMARSFMGWGTEVEGEPQKGDIIVFERGELGWQGHVAFYVSTTTITATGEVFYNVIGGNQSNQVNIEPYSASKVLSIRRPT